jgi:hypothetical protein
MVVGPLAPGRIYSFKVTAVNDGGESFPSEILSVCELPAARSRALVVNGFTRVCGPRFVQADGFSGVMSRLDAGVPDRRALNITGEQYDFDPASRWLTDDAPGHGASHADLEGSIVAGNSFDFPIVHGRALRAAGVSFASASKAAVMDGTIALAPYAMVDLILGEERETGWPRAAMDSIRGRQFKALPKPLQAVLRDYQRSGGDLLVSGAYVGTDLRDSADIAFAKEVLHFRPSNGFASTTCRVVPVRSGIVADSLVFTFSGSPSDSMYAVEAPDGIAPANGGVLALRYGDSATGAAVAWRGTTGVFVLGFPLESVIGETARAALMHEILGFFRR